MTILLKNKETLVCEDFIFHCTIGKNGTTKNKIEGDKKTPKGTFNIGNLYYRPDRHNKPITKLRCIPITKKMGWCDDINSKYYNQLMNISNKIKHEKLFRKDKIYNLVIPINYNTKNPKKNKGSAIFIHLTKNYEKTKGCISLKKKDFLILLKIINKKTLIKII